VKTILSAALLFAAAAALFALSLRSFWEKGFLLNNAYLYATEQERTTMEKTAYYRQTALVFLLLGFVFLLNGLAALLRVDWLSGMAAVVCGITVVYAILSSVLIGKRRRQRH